MSPSLLAGGLPTTGLPGKSNTCLLSTGYVTSSVTDAMKLRYKSVINYNACYIGTFLIKLGNQHRRVYVTKFCTVKVQL